MSLEEFFLPLKINAGLTLKNRFVMAPMTRKLTPEAIPDEELIEYFASRARGGVGLIITEPIAVSHPSANKDGFSPDFATEEKIQGWKAVVRAVHIEGAKIFAQIWHMGWDRDATKAPNPEIRSVSPSKSGEDNYATLEEIQEIIDAFGETAKIAKEIGFDGIEIHGAHGYLIDEFLWDTTNHRNDKYGGSIENRARFAKEIVEVVRKSVGNDFPIGFRVSQWKVQDFSAKLAKNPDELKQIVTPLSETGVDMFHCSTRRFWENEFEGSPLNLAGWVKMMTGKTTITVGSVGLNSVFTESLLSGKGADITSLSKLESKFRDGEFDLVALGRSLIANPDWVNKVHENNLGDLQSFDAEMLKYLK